MATEINKMIFQIVFDEGKVVHKIGKAEVSVKKFSSELKKAQLASKNFNNTLSGRESMTTNAGLAGATLTELGRTISDLPYGIRGVANNLSQLSTLFITMVGKVDDNVKGFARVGRTFKMLGRELMGPLGIILAFQTLIALLDAFGENLFKSKNATDEARKALEKENEELQKNIELRKQRSVDLKKQIQSFSTDFESLRGVVEKYNDTTRELGDTETALQLASEILSEAGIKEGKILRDNNILQIDRINLLDKLLDLNEQETKREEALLNLEIGRNENNKKLQGDARTNALNAQKRIETITKEIELLKESFGVEVTYSDELKKKRQELYNELEDLKAESDYKLLELEFKRQLEELESLNATEEDKFLLRQIYVEKVRDLREKDLSDYKDYLLEQSDEFSDTLDKLYKDFLSYKTADEFIRDWEESQTIILRQVNQAQQGLNQIFSSVTSTLSSLNEIQQTYHQANIDRINREKDLVLQNDSLTQQEKDKRLKEIEAREIAAEKRKIKAERDMFTLQQTIAMGKALMDLKLFKIESQINADLLKQSASKLMTDSATTAAVDTQKATGTLPTFIRDLGAIAGPIVFGASIVGMIASIVKARKTAQNAIRNLVPSANIGSGGSATPISAPAFNVVGATQTSQLAQTIAGAEDKPLRAYVVASDVSTAQELERSTIEGASIG